MKKVESLLKEIDDLRSQLAAFLETRSICEERAAEICFHLAKKVNALEHETIRSG